MTDRYDTINEQLPDGIDPYDEVFVSPDNHTKRWHLGDEKPVCQYGGLRNTRWTKKQIIQIAPHFEMCTKCEEHFTLQHIYDE